MRRLSILLFTFFSFTTLFISACQSKKSAQEILYLEVMEIHDDVMPEMGTIHRLEKQLKAIDTAVVSVPDYPTILSHLGSLKKADEGMMNWMYDFDNPTPDVAEETAIKYLEKEKIKISAVRDQMRESIRSAQTVLQEFKNTTSTDSLSTKK